MATPVSFAPLVNGLDYLQSVTNHLASETTDRPNSRDFKYAVLHLSAGIEVLAKYRLHQEHWTLVLSKPDDSRVDRAAYNRGDFVSVSGEVALARLRRLVGLPLADDDLAAVATVQRLRNKLQHFGLTDSAELIESIAVKALDFCLRFVDEHIAPTTSADDVEMLRRLMPEIREGLGKVEALVRHRMEKLTPALNASDYPVVGCPRCSQTALLLDERPRCAYCGENWESGASAATEYADVVLGLDWYSTTKGGQPPAEDCPECGEAAVVRDQFARLPGPSPALCFACGAEFNNTCSRCGVPVMQSDADDGVPLCGDCWANIIGRD
jgi:hypothetical protein